MKYVTINSSVCFVRCGRANAVGLVLFAAVPWYLKVATLRRLFPAIRDCHVLAAVPPCTH